PSQCTEAAGDSEAKSEMPIKNGDMLRPPRKYSSSDSVPRENRQPTQSTPSAYRITIARLPRDSQPYQTIGENAS
ncbi:MAG: hypothetical protein OSB19_09035, partial [Opitutaceae bacterium]|nr:hypothetical protein [Opitutaceae bacterium]